MTIMRLLPYTTLIDWFFITEMECVYCAVRVEYLQVIQVNFRLESVKQIRV